MGRLTSEIDRITGSSNFNGIKLLGGSLDITATESINETAILGETTAYVESSGRGSFCRLDVQNPARPQWR